MYEKKEPLLTLENISLAYGENLILRDINIQVCDIVREQTTGQVITIVGPSGIGKSQLLNIIAGLIEPTTGAVKIGAAQLPVKIGQVGMVAQTYPLFAHRTLKSNLSLVCKDQAKIDDLLNQFDLFQHKDKYPVTLSGGQRQRTAIVQQLLCSDHFILLDEPFSGLDPLAIDKLCKVIMKVANMDTLNTVLITSHILQPSLAVSDEVWMMGVEYTQKGDKIPGALIRFREDLASKGLAWRPDIRYDPEFISFCNEIEKSFKLL